MAAPQAATQFNDLLRRAVDLLEESTDDLTLRRFEADVERLRAADPVGTLELKAHIAAARGADTQASELYERVFKMVPGDPSPVIRYLILLGNTGRSTETRTWYEKYRTTILSDVRALRMAREVLCSSGWWVTAQGIEKDLQRMSLPTDAISDEFCAVGEALSREEDVAQAVGFVRTFLRARKAPVDAVHIMSAPQGDGGSSLFFQFALGVPCERVADLEWDLFGELDREQLPLEMTRELVFSLIGTEGDGYANLQ